MDKCYEDNVLAKARQDGVQGHLALTVQDFDS